MSTDVGLLVETQAAILWEGKPADGFPLTQYFFENVVRRKNPINYQYYAQHILHELDASCSREDLLKSCIAFISLANFDPLAFYRCSKIIQDCLEDASPKLQTRLLYMVNEVASNCYPLETKQNMMYPIGELRYRLGDYEGALEALQESMRLHGMDGKTAMCAALCYEMLANTADAQKYQKLAQQYKQ